MNAMYGVVRNAAAWAHQKKAKRLMGCAAAAALGFIATGNVAFAQANGNGAPQARNTTDITQLDSGVTTNQTNTTSLPSQTRNGTVDWAQRDTIDARALTAWPIALFPTATPMR